MRLECQTFTRVTPDQLNPSNLAWFLVPIFYLFYPISYSQLYRGWRDVLEYGGTIAGRLERRRINACRKTKLNRYHYIDIITSISLHRYHYIDIVTSISLHRYHYIDITASISLHQYHYINIVTSISLHRYRYIDIVTSIS